jgi:DNA-binding response OmpR family regulator
MTPPGLTHAKQRGVRVSESQSNYVSRIVVIDDDHELLKLIALLLRRIGAQSRTFFDGQEALNHLQLETPDLVILDLMLPDIDGLEILRQLRSQRRFDHVPVIILSAKADPNTIRKGLENGADGYVTKPYIANTLIDRVRLLLSTGRQNVPYSDETTPPDLS